MYPGQRICTPVRVHARQSALIFYLLNPSTPTRTSISRKKRPPKAVKSLTFIPLCTRPVSFNTFILQFYCIKTASRLRWYSYRAEHDLTGCEAVALFRKLNPGLPARTPEPGGPFHIAHSCESTAANRQPKESIIRLGHVESSLRRKNSSGMSRS
jgi:hypothetical protein